jgi:A1 cistron-splicing factor AAR2
LIRNTYTKKTLSESKVFSMPSRRTADADADETVSGGVLSLLISYYRFHLTRRFSGIKFIPPGLHMITWSASPSAGQRHQPSNPGDTVSTDRPDLANIAGAGPAAIPIRSALLRIWNPRERVILSYDRQTESVPHSPSSVSGAPNDEEEPAQVISEDHLRTLDPEMAAYPWDGFPRWSGLTNLITREVLSGVLGNGRVDAMTPVEGEVDEAARKGADRFTVPQTETGITEAVPPPATTEAGGARGGESGNPAAGTGSAPASALASLASASAEERAMRFAQFELKRSWAEGAVGEEVTKWSRDKSWLLGHVVTEQLEGGE